MKKFVQVIAMAAMMLYGGQALAQSHGAMLLGASFPMKDFATFDGFNDFSLINPGSENAGASIGFNVGFKWYFNVGVNNFNVMLSLDGFFNGPNSNLKTAYQDNVLANWGELRVDNISYNSTPKFINLPIMLGLNYMFPINPKFGIYVEAGAGGNFRFITYLGTVSNETETQNLIKMTQNYDKAFTFAYQAGIGFKVDNRLLIGCSFYDLGKADVKGEQTIKEITTTNTTVSSNYLTMGAIHPIMVLARIGFTF